MDPLASIGYNGQPVRSPFRVVRPPIAGLVQLTVLFPRQPTVRHLVQLQTVGLRPPRTVRPARAQHGQSAQPAGRRARRARQTAAPWARGYV
ncbi:hypothetical protein [Mycobacterium avium]|uniref:hypothetical protein n=1 Tax=Mycobacterium avium TaxID=1764 RepID=UPI0007A09E23|nr:hypothetical protein [Mycobacterium avium]